MKNDGLNAEERALVNRIAWRMFKKFWSQCSASEKHQIEVSVCGF